jgi:hypothetical protein
MWNKIFIILFEIGFGVKFNFIGTISISELFLIFTSAFFVKQQLFRNYPELKKISFLYLGLLCAQIISEIIIGNTLSNTLRGLAVTVVSYLHFIFLFRLIIKEQIIIISALAGMIIRQLIFSNEVENIGFEEIITGERATFVKFYLASIITNALLILSIFTKQKLMSLLLILVGGILVILGARSAGMMNILTGMIAYTVITMKSINWNRLILSAIFILIAGYWAYAVYVDRVLTGKIISGNSWQLTQMKNPYNPIGLLLMGRTEVFVGWEAFMDEFWFGHGAWAIDKTGKYDAMMFILKDSEYKNTNPDENIIPTHSVLIGAGMYNGIFAFLFMFTILHFFVKRGILSIRKNDPYIIVLISFIIWLLWTVLFSPSSHFRLSIPLYFATFLVFYRYIQSKENDEQHYKNNKDESENFNFNSNIRRT